MSQRKASEAMSLECGGKLTADSIRKRHAYYGVKQRTSKVGKTSHSDDDQVGKTSQEALPLHLEAPDEAPAFIIPQDVGQSQLVTALAQFFSSKGASPDAVKNTFNRIILEVFPIDGRTLVDSAFVTFAELPEVIGEHARKKDPSSIADALFRGIIEFGKLTRMEANEVIRSLAAKMEENDTIS